MDGQRENSIPPTNKVCGGGGGYKNEIAQISIANFHTNPITPKILFNILFILPQQGLTKFHSQYLALMS